MRILALYILFVIASCQTTISKEKLLGSWTTEQDESKYPKNGVLDKLTFFENDSFKFEMYLNGKLHESFSGKYIFDEKRKLITTKVDTMEFTSEIIELTNSRLSTKNEKMKTISNYKRL
jgi:hypothetical protein